MDFQITSALNNDLGKAQQFARESGHNAITPLHFLYALNQDPNSILANVLKVANINAQELNNEIIKEINSSTRNSNQGLQNISPSKALFEIFKGASETSVKLNYPHITTEVFLATMVNNDKDVIRILSKVGLPTNKFNEILQNFIPGTAEIEKQVRKDSASALSKFTVDITELARENKLDPVIGRDEEIRRAMQILQRRTKNNPVLIGEPGVGKTAIVEGLAQRIISGEVPEGLRQRSLLRLDLASMIAGSEMHGEFEKRLKAVLEEITSNTDKYILFIDELHSIVGAGRANNMDVANMLKPALARGELRCIGATTLDEYRMYIEKDPALERRFQKLLVLEPDIDSAISILRGLSDRYSIHHGVRISDPAIVAAVELSHRYIADRFLPDKAIDLIDEAAAKLKIEHDSKPEEIDRLERKLAQHKIDEAAIKKETDSESKERLKAISDQIKETEKELANFNETWSRERANFQTEKQIKARINEIEIEILELKKQGKWDEAAILQHENLPRLTKALEESAKTFQSELLSREIGEREIAEVVAKATGIPVANVLDSNKERILNIKDYLKKYLINQDQAIEAVASALMRTHSGLSDPNQPNGCFMFLGPTGVGKTQLSKLLAKYLFNSEKQLIRFDMSEYMEKHSVARLIGSPPGYVGFEKGGQLTEAVKRKPYSVILFDEIEKAHPEVFNILLQTLDDGRLTDGQGKVIDFRNTIIILTSNIGSANIIENLDEDVSSEVMNEVRRRFQPEFLNRIDEIIIFNTLEVKDIAKITELHLDELKEKLAHEKFTLTYKDKVPNVLTALGSDLEYGARPLKRTIQKYIETPLATKILANEFEPGDTIEISTKEKEFIFKNLKKK